MRQFRLITGLFCILMTGECLPSATVNPYGLADTILVNPWYLKVLDIPRKKALEGKVVKVAVVDEGFRTTHRAIRDYLFINPGEKPGNFQDDDHNGYKDDLHGWDVSDNDTDVSVPKGREDLFWHGTYVSGIIASVMRECFGDDASKLLKIIPVKAVSDKARSIFMTDAFKGIEYALTLDPDIICCAWNGGQFSGQEKSILEKALAKGIIIIGPAGNFNAEMACHPADYAGVFCTASLDSTLHKSNFSNYGMRIDFALPGSNIPGPHPAADNAYIHESGTSPAAAILAGCAAILKSLVPGANSQAIFDVLQNTACPVDSLNLRYCGKLGAGLPDLAKASEYLVNREYSHLTFSSARPKGKIVPVNRRRYNEWTIHPPGSYEGIHLISNSTDSKVPVKIYSGDSIAYSGPAGGIADWIFLPGNSTRIVLDTKGGRTKDLSFSYYMETIDSTKLYCQEKIDISDMHGEISDGSGQENYANKCSCQWQVTAPEGKHIRIDFSSLDTEPNEDYVWIFDGESALEEKLLAKFSGSNLPPPIGSFTNKVLIWFLTNGSATGKGWDLKYSVVD